MVRKQQYIALSSFLPLLLWLAHSVEYSAAFLTSQNFMRQRSTLATATFLCSRIHQSIHIKAYAATGSFNCQLLQKRNLSKSSFFKTSTLLMESNTNEPIRTGWTHNQPKKWTSSGVKDDATSSTEQQSTSKQEMRTGWLHNTEAPPSSESITNSKSTIGSPNGQKREETIAQRLLRLEKRKKRIHHRIIHPPSFHCCGGKSPIVVTEHKIAVPLTHSNDIIDPDQRLGGEDSTPETVDVYFTITEKVKDEKEEQFFRSLQQISSATQRAAEYIQHASLKDASKMILYLQGGPGFGSPTPVVGLGLEGKSSWAAQAINNEGFERVVLMDQRGTGRSTPITKQTLEKKFPKLFQLDQSQKKIFNNDPLADYNYASMNKSLEYWKDAEPDTYNEFHSSLESAVEYMSKFRADSIVRDAEEIKDALLLPLENTNNESNETQRPWGAALGQSFGGFCMMSYLSLIPNPPKICLLTGGIAPMLTSPFDVYKSLWERVKERNYLYYDMYPGDIQLVHKIVSALLERPVTLPSGGILTARRFLQLGISFGGTPSSFASLHSLFSSAIVDNDSEDGEEQIEFTRAFLKHMDSCQPFDDHPIYFLMHESIYGDGDRFGATNWAAHRAFEERIKTPDDFSYKLTSKMKSDDRPTLLSGEMVFPWMADGDFAEVSGLGMKALAHALAYKNDWTPLYNESAMKKALDSAGGVSKAAAAVYYDDMYVDFDACMKVAKGKDSPLGNCKLYITNEYQHSGLRDDGAAIFSKLLGMARGTIRTPS